MPSVSGGGTHILTIAENETIHNGTVLTIPSAGLPDLNDPHIHGDINVRFNVRIPPTPEEISALAQMSRN